MVEETPRVGGTRPLDEEGWEALPALLLALRIAMANTAFYPAKSKQVTTSLDSAYSHLAKMLDRGKTLILAESEGSLLANGQPLKEEQAMQMAGIFLQSLVDCRIKSVTFKQGLDLDELHVFLRGLAEKKWKKEKGVVLAEQLKQSRIYHIGLDEKIYVAIGDGDLVIEKARDIIATAGGRIDEIMRAIDEAAEMVGSIEDGTSRDKVRGEIAKRFLEMDPAAFADIMKRRDTGEIKVVKEKAIATFADERIREIVAELSNTYVNLKKSAGPGSPVTNEMKHIKDAINKILELGGEGSVSIEIYQEMVRKGILEEAARWEDVTTEEDIMARAEKIAQCNPNDLITPEAVAEIKRVLAELKLREEEELAARIMKAVGAGLSSPTADIRLKVAETLSSISAEVASFGSRELDGGLSAMVIEAEEKESDPRVYKTLGRLLAELAKKFIDKFDFEEARKAVSMFRKHKGEAGAGFPERSEFAMEELMWIGNKETAMLLLAELRSEDQSRRREAHDIVMRLEVAMIRHLVNAIKETEELPHRKYLSSILKSLGEEATVRLVEEFEADMSVSSSIRLMEVMDGMANREIALEQLRKTLSHPHPQVRHEVIGTLKRFGGKAAGEIITTVLGDRNFYVLRFAVQSIGDIGYREATERLVGLSRIRGNLSAEEEDALLEEIGVSLGKLRDDRSIPFLISIARARMLAGLFKKGYSTSVRVAAIRALGRFGTAEARDALQLLKKEKDTDIRNAAMSALSS